MNSEGKMGWEEIVDSALEGEYDGEELNEIAGLAYKCINRAPRKRPSMRDVVQVLTRILKTRNGQKRHRKGLSATADEVSIDVDHTQARIHRREESMDSTADTYEV